MHYFLRARGVYVVPPKNERRRMVKLHGCREIAHMCAMSHGTFPSQIQNSTWRQHQQQGRVYHVAVRVFQIIPPIGIRKRWRSKVHKEALTCLSTNDNVATFHPIYEVMRSPASHFNPPILPPPLPNFDSGHETENRLSRSNFEMRGSTFSILSFRASERRMRCQGII